MVRLDAVAAYGALPLMLASALACAHPAVADGRAGDVLQAREPDGVFLDSPAARPPPRAVASARGVVALSLPLSREEVQTILHAYFRAFASGDASAFLPLLARSARHVEDGSSTDLATSLEKRLRTVDYTHLAFDVVAFYDDARIIPFEVASDHLQRPLGMRPGDVLIDVPIRIQQLGIVRIFGPRVELVLRRDDPRGTWQIAAVREPDGPWT